MRYRTTTAAEGSPTGATGADRSTGHGTVTQRHVARSNDAQRSLESAVRDRAWAPVQLARDAHSGLDDAGVQAAAAQGIAGGGQPLPYLDAIQRSFGEHDISGVRAHFGGAAAEANAALGASAYATGNDVAFAEGSPSLFLVAHEAAHVVQQRSGVHLSSAVGQAGDAYEQHADAVAEAVVRGENAAGLLERPAGAATGTVQRTPRKPKEQEEAAEVMERTAVIGELIRIRIPADTLYLQGGPGVEAEESTEHKGIKVAQFRAIKPGTTTIKVVKRDGSSLDHVVMILDQGFVARTRAGRKLSPDEVNRIDKFDDEEFDVVFRWHGDTHDRATITVESREHDLEGHQAAFKVGTGKWSGDGEITWTNFAQRPGKAAMTFRVMSGGKEIAKTTYRIERVVTRADSHRLVDQVNTERDKIFLAIHRWANRQAGEYYTAFTRYDTAVQNDAAVDAAVNAALFSIASIAIAGVAGGYAKWMFLAQDKTKPYEIIRETVATDVAKGITRAGLDFGAAMIDGAGGGPKDPHKSLIDIESQALDQQELMIADLEKAKDEWSRLAELELDPAVIVRNIAELLGLPWGVCSADDFERAMWKKWLENNRVVSWVGLPRRHAVARLDALGIPHEEPWEDAGDIGSAAWGGA